MNRTPLSGAQLRVLGRLAHAERAMYARIDVASLELTPGAYLTLSALVGRRLVSSVAPGVVQLTVHAYRVLGRR